MAGFGSPPNSVGTLKDGRGYFVVIHEDGRKREILCSDAADMERRVKVERERLMSKRPR